MDVAISSVPKDPRTQPCTRRWVTSAAQEVLFSFQLAHSSTLNSLMIVSFPVAIFKTTKYLLMQKSPSSELNSALVQHYWEDQALGWTQLSPRRGCPSLSAVLPHFPLQRSVRRTFITTKPKPGVVRHPEINNCTTEPLRSTTQNTVQTEGPGLQLNLQFRRKNLKYSKAYF